MFSFRTTPLEDQMDKALTEGGVGCFCTQNCWDAGRGRYMYDLFRERGNLKMIFSPEDTELSPNQCGIAAPAARLRELNAVVVEIQDAGSRYFGYTRDVFRLMDTMKEIENAPSLYIVDHVNPAGRAVEGTMGSSPKIAHRHGLTLGELANLYYNEIGAKFPLHVISFLATEANRQMMPWTIALSSDIPGFFTCDLYGGGGLWNGTNVSPGTGTARPYEYIGAPFVRPESPEKLPQAAGAMLRQCSFTPSCGPYEGRKCYGYQIILEAGEGYHSLLHTLALMRFFRERYPEFDISGLPALLDDETLYGYVCGDVSPDDMKEYVKVEEQKWIRKSRKFLLYDNAPYRIK